MQIRAFQAFVEIMRQNGFSAAAKTLHATQSTISKSLAQLESYYGARLIHRGKGALQLTSEGEYVYCHALHILAEQEAIKRDLDELKGLKKGVLKIGLPPIGSSELFAPVLARYTKAYPKIEIQIVEHGSKKLEELVKLGEIELAASLFPVAEGFGYQDVRNEPVVALMPNTLAKGRKALSAVEIAHYPFVLFESQFALTPIVLEAFQKKELKTDVSARTSQIDFLFGLIAAGMGIGFLPRMIAQKRVSDDVCMVEISDINIAWHMALIWRDQKQLSHAATQWLKLSETFRDHS
ncbi:LysR family transcriptional regulator [Bartonella tamiae]|uniref:HTH lysR-type domain-containing protein n=1 Tax=Bartonella tamiae Th239 TaxID=1094558 RepID=J0QTZ8_9HYPH|nr:LysR family transcriptional regulator [Bartonella tamiae]EJF89386.1 hypothetical protein ME5_01937 [Bartonella tamiae Th239]EJF92749.1 hypothetical protein MEG_01919 [Bartonella tamiae Th307]